MTALDDLRSWTNDEAIVKVAKQMLEDRNKEDDEIREYRNAAIRRLVKKYGWAKTAEIADMSVSGVKWINGPKDKS